MLRKYGSKIYTNYLKPVSKSPYDQRREFIVNIIVGIFMAAAIAAVIFPLVSHLTAGGSWYASTLYGALFAMIFAWSLWLISRKGHYKICASLLVAIIIMASLRLMLSWSFDLPLAQMILALAVVVAGIILSSTAAALYVAVTMIFVLSIAYLQARGILLTNSQWLTEPLIFSDAITQAVILFIIGGLSWMANWRMDGLLQQGHDRQQPEQVADLQNYAEFGRISSNLLHDLANPLTAASLQVQQVASRSPRSRQAMVSLHHIERYIEMARRQLTGISHHQVFNVSPEIHQVVELLNNKARSCSVSITFKAAHKDVAYGDPVALQRVLANLIVNSIDAYKTPATCKLKTVLVSVETTATAIKIKVKDRGMGIKSADLPHIFKDFYSTKKQIGRGVGIGLASAKSTIEQYFNGNISVDSSPRQGTLFTITIPRHMK